MLLQSVRRQARRRHAGATDRPRRQPHAAGDAATAPRLGATASRPKALTATARPGRRSCRPAVDQTGAGTLTPLPAARRPRRGASPGCCWTGAGRRAAHPPRARARARRGDRGGLAGLGRRRCCVDRLPAGRDRAAVAAPGGGGRRGVRRALGRARHRHGVAASRWRYLLPVLAAVLDGSATTRAARATRSTSPRPRRSPRDQLRAIRGAHAGRGAGGDVRRRHPARGARLGARARRRRARPTPTCCTARCCRRHARWAPFLRRLRYVVVDECHGYRGVFGSTSRRCCAGCAGSAARYGADPVFVLASATVAEPGVAARRLTGLDVVEVDRRRVAARRDRRSRCGSRRSTGSSGGENGAPVRRSATAESGRPARRPRRRRGARRWRSSARGAAPRRWPCRRGGRWPRSRPSWTGGWRRTARATCPRSAARSRRRCASGELLGVAATNALELGVDVCGLDAVVLDRLAGHPARRCGSRPGGPVGRGQEALAVLRRPRRPARHLPRAPPGGDLRAAGGGDRARPGQPVRAGAAPVRGGAELPLTDGRPGAVRPDQPRPLLADLVRRGLLRHRPSGWFWTRRERRPTRSTSAGQGGPPVRMVEAGTGRLLGTRRRGRRAHHGAPRRGLPAPGRDLPGDRARPRRARRRWSHADDARLDHVRARRHRHAHRRSRTRRSVHLGRCAGALRDGRR